MGILDNKIDLPPTPTIPPVERLEKTSPAHNDRKPRSEYQEKNPPENETEEERKRREKNKTEDKGTIIDEIV